MYTHRLPTLELGTWSLNKTPHWNKQAVFAHNWAYIRTNTSTSMLKKRVAPAKIRHRCQRHGFLATATLPNYRPAMIEFLRPVAFTLLI